MANVLCLTGGVFHERKNRCREKEDPVFVNVERPVKESGPKTKKWKLYKVEMKFI